MKIYAVYGYFNWEGGGVIAIFDTKEKAEFYEKRQKRHVKYYDDYMIKEYTVQ